jgi:hypothetical protein
VYARGHRSILVLIYLYYTRPRHVGQQPRRQESSYPTGGRAPRPIH